TMNALTMLYRDAGQTDKALQLAEQTLEVRKRNLPPNHLDVLVSMNNLALLYLDQKRTESALHLFEETLDGMKKEYGPMHPERLNTTRNLARAYHSAEQIDKALLLQETIVRQYKTAHGLDYSRTQDCIDDLIAYYVDMGLCDKAEALLSSIRAGGSNRQPTVNPKQGQREKRLGDLVQRVKPAADKYQKELTVKQAEHPDTLAARQAFAVVLRDQKCLTAAAYHLRAVLE